MNQNRDLGTVQIIVQEDKAWNGMPRSIRKPYFTQAAKAPPTIKS